MAQRWWDGDPRERFWLESTDRKDIGEDLRAPLSDDSGRDNWRYTLVREAKLGDLVFHYDKRAKAISAVSRIASAPEDAPILWAARGSYARERGARPQLLPGFKMKLDRHQKLAQPLTLEALRAAKPDLISLYDGLVRERGEPLYFPFELSDRDVRGLQGYAFKLPAHLVAQFPELSVVADRLPAGSEGVPSELAVFEAALAAMSAAVPEFAFADFHKERAARLGLKRVEKRLFSAGARGDDWAIHHGGRLELQFNVGLDWLPDGSRAFRAGVAFSVETSRSYDDMDVLLPKIDRFNGWLQEHPEALQDLAMWHWQDDVRSVDRKPTLITADLFRNKTFIFLGARQPIDAIDPRQALAMFDRLLPLYRYVEAEASKAKPRPLPSPPDELRLDFARDLDDETAVHVSLPERTLDYARRHRQMQRSLKAELLREGFDKVAIEGGLGQRSIDLVAFRGDQRWFYEVKVLPSARACLREAIGQLLEYSLWRGATPPAGVVVVGEHPRDDDVKAYLATLNASFPVPLEYREFRRSQESSPAA